MKKPFCLMLLAIIAFGCSNDEQPGTEATTRITATIQPFTGDGASLTALWSSDDAITLLNEGKAVAQLSLSSGDGTPTGTFTGVLSSADGKDVLAVYPKVLSDKGPIVLQSEQNYSSESDINAYDVRIGSGRIVASNKTEIDMSSILCALKLDVTLGREYAEENIHSVQIIVPDKVLAGTFSLSLGDTSQATELSDRVTVGLPTAPKAAGTVTVYALTAPCDLTDAKSVKYVVTTANGAVTFCRKPADVLASGKIVTVDLDISKFKLVAGEPGEGEYSTTIIDTHGPTDLNDPAFYGISAPEGVYANSYLINEPGNYAFDATVTGNGPAGIMPEGQFHTSTAAIAPRSAALIWQDKPGLITSVTLDQGKIVFVTADTFTPGNAVIAAYDGADADGDILWSWHIWITDKPALEKLVNLEGHEFTFMDRNLGATSKTPGEAGSLGLLYQWGRKDPFPNSASATEVVQPTIYDLSGAGSTDMVSTVQTTRELGTIEYTVSNPTTFLCAQDTITSGDWYYGDGIGRDSRNFYLWGNPDGYEYKTLSETVKTIYDPCPVGYRVPGTFAWSAVTYNGHFTPVPDEWSVEGAFNYGYMVVYDGTNTTFYPANGCFSTVGRLDDTGAYGHYWQNGPFSETGSYVTCFGFANWYIHPDNECSTSTARAVRCVKE